MCSLSLRVCSLHMSLRTCLVSCPVQMLCIDKSEAFLVKLVRAEVSAFLRSMAKEWSRIQETIQTHANWMCSGPLMRTWKPHNDDQHPLRNLTQCSDFTQTLET